MIKLLYPLFLLVLTMQVQAQNIGIGTNTPDASAKLHIEDPNRGLLIPRISIPNLNAAAPVTAPATALLVYNTDPTSGEGFHYWDGTQWIKLVDGIDHDWYEVGTTTAPNDINDDIFTLGNVGIGTITPTERLEIDNGGIQLNGDFGIGFSGERPLNVNTTADAARIYYNNDGSTFGLSSFHDFLVIEKTDINGTNPDGGVLFINQGVDNIKDVSMAIRGDGNIGVGTYTPSEKFHIQNGSIRIVDGTEGVDKVLVSDANGVGSWQSLAGSWAAYGINATSNNGTRNVTFGNSTINGTGGSVNNANGRIFVPTAGLYRVILYFDFQFGTTAPGCQDILITGFDGSGATIFFNCDDVGQKNVGRTNGYMQAIFNIPAGGYVQVETGNFAVEGMVSVERVN